MKILIIEDDPSLSELLCYGLENEAFEVTVCHDGPDGLKTAMENLHDIILLDRMLPGISGEGVPDKIRLELTAFLLPCHMYALQAEPDSSFLQYSLLKNYNYHPYPNSFPVNQIYIKTV